MITLFIDNDKHSKYNYNNIEILIFSDIIGIHDF